MTCSHSIFQFVDQIMSFPTIQNLTPTSLGGYHLIFAVILIFKHATFLRLSSMSATSALAHAEVDYRERNIDSNIRHHLSAPSQEHSDESFARFIMAIDLCRLSLQSKSHLHRKDRCFTLFWESIFPCKFIFLVQLTRRIRASTAEWSRNRTS
ncbi:hypothetical protein EDB85DRAFT_309005 [Lactarius pseudohatsudake]|nr:hypothetical protein EDB85DRAFT_309005 [Lactarius pseudohatsudake]